MVGRSSPSPVPSGVCGSATALMSAAAAGHVEIIASLLAADAKPDATNDYGCGQRLGRRVSVGCCSRLCCRVTALTIAVCHGHARVVELLIAAGADVAVKADGG